MAFASSRDFLEHIKQNEREHFLEDAPDEAFEALYRKQALDLGVPMPPSSEYRFDYLVQQLKQRIESVMTQEDRERFNRDVAVGVLEHENVNAFIVREDDCYAVIINEGLMLFLNKYLKLYCAALDPSAVIYCSRGESSGFGAEDYIGMAGEVMGYYASEGLIRGPRVLLDMTSDTGLAFAQTLHEVETFVLAHEIGHFVNGDLEDLGHFHQWRADSSAGVFHNDRHEKEFAADRFAFRTLARLAFENSPDYPAIGLLMNATLVFNVLRGISDQDSYKHPASSRRLLAVVGEFFGEEAADLMEKSFDDSELVGEFQALLAGRTVSDILGAD